MQTGANGYQWQPTAPELQPRGVALGISQQCYKSILQ